MDSIRYVVYRSHLAPATPDAEVRDYIVRFAALLRGQYPGAEIDIRERVSGVGSGLQGDHDPETRDYVERLAELAWKSCSVLGCPRTMYAEEMCEPHYRRAKRGSASTAPVRTRGKEPLRALSLRVPVSVMERLGSEPAATARKVLTEWAAGGKSTPRPRRQPKSA